MSAELTAADPWLRPQWDRAALLTIDSQVDFVEGGASPIPGTATVVPAVAQLATTFRVVGRPVVRLYVAADVDLARRTLLDAGAPIVRPGQQDEPLAECDGDHGPALRQRRRVRTRAQRRWCGSSGSRTICCRASSVRCRRCRCWWRCG